MTQASVVSIRVEKMGSFIVQYFETLKFRPNQNIYHVNNFEWLIVKLPMSATS